MKNILAILLFLVLVNPMFSKTFFIHPVDGNDNNTGLQKESPWKSFKNLQKIKIQAGDEITIAAGFEIKGSLILKDISGTEKNPIIIYSYQDTTSKSEFATINAFGFDNGILLENTSHVKIKNLIITANGGNHDVNSSNKGMRCGILVTTTKPVVSENIEITNVSIFEVYFENKHFIRPTTEVKTANGTQSYGYGIRFINRSKNSLIKHISVQNSLIKDVGHTGIKFTSSTGGIQDIRISGNSIINTGGPGVQIGSVLNGHVYENIINGSGSTDDSRKWGRGSGLWTWDCSDILIEKNQFLNANGPADSAGIHIDFNCKHIVVQYNLSRNNAGGFCEILGNNYNCSYRYNVSINDGYRIKGEDGNYQEGKVFWLSGFNGKNKDRKGPYNSYFYNNTMYVSKNNLAKIAIDRTSKGVLIANNIFHFEGNSKHVLGDQYKPETHGEIGVENIIFKNNIYLKSENWPTEAIIQDTNPFYGNSNFKNSGGEQIADYIPTNIELIKNKGIDIPNIPNDPIGLKVKLKVDVDILGNQIKGLPDIGAIELP